MNFDIIKDFSLIDKPAFIILCIFEIIILVLICTVLLRRKKGFFFFIGTVVFGVLLYFVYNTIKPFNVAFPWYIFGSFTVFLLSLFIFKKPVRFVLSLLLSVTVCLGFVNYMFTFFPTFADIGKPAAAPTITEQELNGLHKAPIKDGHETGVVSVLDVPSVASNFKARKAHIYLPPAYFRGEKLPVIVMLAGIPGDPEDFFGPIRIANVLEKYQLEHAGYAPIVVAADYTGDRFGNPGCIDGKDKKVQTYLTKDVPDFLINRFNADADTGKWQIGGISSGGTCAFQVVTEHPDVFKHFIDISGEDEILILNHPNTVNTLFNGSEEEYKKHNPVDIMQTKPETLKQVTGKFVIGKDDKDFQQQLKHLNSLSTSIGMKTEYIEVRGKHGILTWNMGFRIALKESEKIRDN